MKKESKSNKNTMNNILKEVKKVLKNIASGVKKFANKDFGKFYGKHVLYLFFIIVFVLLVLNIFKKDDKPLYPMVYQNVDGELMLLENNAKEGIKLSSNDSTNDVIYSNTSDRYVLFMRNSSLYLFDKKHKDDKIKIVNDVKNYGFTENDKYVVAVDEEDNLYSYNFKSEREKLDSDINSVKDISNEKVIYVKEDALYIRSLNADKDDRDKITNEYGTIAAFSKDGKKVLYLDSENDLKYYVVKNGENEKIASDVYDYYCDDKCDKLYYIVYDDSYTLYYYDGKESVKIANDVYEVSDIDVDKKQVVYAKYKNGKYTLYYQKMDKEPVKMEKGLDEMLYVKIFNGKEIYYIDSDGKVKYTKINGDDLGKIDVIVKDVDDYLKFYKDGVLFVKNVDKNSNGDLYIVKNGKAKKIDSDVYSSYIDVSADGKKIFYLKDYSSNSGQLCVSNGGKGKKIDSDVYKYQYIGDKLIYYLKDYSVSKKRGDLFRYTGGKGKRVVEDVSSMASNQNGFDLNE